MALCLLVAAPALAGTEVFEERRPLCLECHGENGVSTIAETPSLGDLPEFYALLQLVAFREGNRDSEIMEPMVEGMSDDDLRAAAAFVAELPPLPPPEEAGDPQRMERGAALAAKHHCNQCHGPDFRGDAKLPPIRHQREDYLLKALLDFKAERRMGARAAMVEALLDLDEADLADLAHYLAHVQD
jgi:cytochrome c553